MRAILGGLDLGALDTAGVKWTNQKVDGWGSTGSSIKVENKLRSPGAWAGVGNALPRHISIKGLCRGVSEDAVSDALDRLNNAVGFDDTLLTITEGSRSRWCTVRRTDDVLRSDLSPTISEWSIQVVALDPRKRGAELASSTHLPSSVGGLSIPFTVPFTIPSTRVSGQVNLTNPGNEVGPVFLRIDGPCAGPVVTHVSSGLSLVFASSLVLGVGEWLDVDMEGRRVLANGQSSRANWVTSRGWSGFEPGPNTWAFTAATYSPDSLLTVRATPSWK